MLIVLLALDLSQLSLRIAFGEFYRISLSA